jgi:hypothetical protein
MCEHDKERLPAAVLSRRNMAGPAGDLRADPDRVPAGGQMSHRGEPKRKKDRRKPDPLYVGVIAFMVVLAAFLYLAVANQWGGPW